MRSVRDVGALAVGAAWLTWWAPTLALNAAQLAAAHARFRAKMLAVDVLYALRRDRAARANLARLIRRKRRGVQAARRRVR